MVHTIASFLHTAAAGFENQLVGDNLAPGLGHQEDHKDPLVENLARLHHSHCCRHRHPLDHLSRPSRRQGMEVALDLAESKGHCHSHLALHGSDTHHHLGSLPVGTCLAPLALGAFHSDDLTQMPLVDVDCS